MLDRVPSDEIFPPEVAVAGKAAPALQLPVPAPRAAGDALGLPFSVAIPAAADAIALTVAATLVGQLNLLGATWVVLTFLALAGTNKNHLRINPQLSTDITRLLAVPAITLLMVSLSAGVLHGSAVDLHRFLLVGPLAGVLVVVGRGLAYAGLRVARARRLLAEPTLIIGTGALGAHIATTLLERSEYGLLPVGFLGDRSDATLALPVLGDPTALERVVRQFSVRRIIVAFGGSPDGELVDVLRRCEPLPVEVHVIPRFFELAAVPDGPLVDHLLGVPVVHLRRSALGTASWWSKRVVDILIASLALVLSAPLLIAAAVAVRGSSPGPLLFRQRRVGGGGEEFDVLKFRTMPVNQDSDTTWSVAEDSRLTRVGRLLRKMNMDELPQLVNVIRGEMSLVGPRPERPYFVRRFATEIPWYAARHRVPVGLTGLAQVHGLRGDTSIPDRARLDNHYIEHWSPWLDVVILLRTVGVMLRGGGH
jgi:exopolysaccharide biosynthesis polyprenyl glycosylphosphotransferase